MIVSYALAGCIIMTVYTPTEVDLVYIDVQLVTKFVKAGVILASAFVKTWSKRLIYNGLLLLCVTGTVYALFPVDFR